VTRDLSLRISGSGFLSHLNCIASTEKLGRGLGVRLASSKIYCTDTILNMLISQVVWSFDVVLVDPGVKAALSSRIL